MSNRGGCGSYRSWSSHNRLRSNGGGLHACGFGGRVFRFLFRLRGGFRAGFRVGESLKVPAYFFRYVYRNRTGVRFLFRDAVSRQKVNDRFGFDLQLAGQLVNADLICVAHVSC
jgi:hypothetical protein